VADAHRRVAEPRLERPLAADAFLRLNRARDYLATPIV
jgi:hypothetical protein